jgi:hypothetical protein
MREPILIVCGCAGLLVVLLYTFVPEALGI